MKLLTFVGIIASANAAPIEIIGGVSKEVACKDYKPLADIATIDGCEEDAVFIEGTFDLNPDYDTYKCAKSAPIPSEATSGFYTASSWSEAVAQCESVFTTEEVGDRKCLMVTYYEADDFDCSAHLASEQKDSFGPLVESLIEA